MSSYQHIVCPHCSGVNRVPAARLNEKPKCGVCHQNLFDGRPIELGPANFSKHTTRSDLPVLVDFWAPWCGPCKMMAPVFSQVAERLSTQMRLAKVNTQDHPSLAAQYGIRGIPTLVIFKQGKEVGRISGALDAAGLQAWAERHL